MGLFPIKLTGETFSIVYAELFSVRFDHAAFENANEKFISRDLSIQPDADTKEKMANYHLQLRWDENRLVCFIETRPFNPPNKSPRVPKIDLPVDFKLRFLVNGSPNFLANTYIVAAGKNKTYQFTNTINHQSGGNVWLFTAIDFYAPAHDYEVGTLVQDSGKFYTTKKQVLAANGISLSNSDYWEGLPGPLENVVNNDDLADNAVVKSKETSLGVIDMVKTGAIDPSYQLFDSGDKLFDPAPEFIIAFKRIVKF